MPVEPIEELVIEQIVVALQAPHIMQMVVDRMRVLRSDLDEPLVVFQRNPLPVNWLAQREVVARFDA